MSNDDANDYDNSFVNSSDTYTHYIQIEYCHVSVILDNVDVLHLEGLQVYRPVRNNGAFQGYQQES